MSEAKAGLTAIPAPSTAAKHNALIRYMDRAQATAVWQQLGLVIWRGECDRPSLLRLEEMALEVSAKFTKGFALMSIVESTAAVPSTEMRRLSAALSDRLVSSGLMGIAQVVPRSGFFGSVARGVITSMGLLSRASHPFKVFETPEDAARWIAALLGERHERVDPSTYARAAVDARAQYAAYWARVHAEPVRPSGSLGH